MTCEYWNHGVPYGTSIIEPPTAQRYVLDGELEFLTEAHVHGTCLCPALEYAARMGKHRVTQHLLQLGVPVTRQAIHMAAKRQGMGLDLLLSAMTGEHLEHARRAALTFRLTYGEFEKAYAMLDLGTQPECYAISGAHSGAVRHPDRSEFHHALDKILQRISKNDLERANLNFIVGDGRTVHIERTAEILERPMSALLPLVFNSKDCVQRLRELGVRMDAAAFKYSANDLSYEARVYPKVHMEKVCRLALNDGCEGTIPFDHIQKLIKAYFGSAAPFIAKELTSGSIKEMSESFSLVARCIRSDERMRLHEIVSGWSQDQSGVSLSNKSIETLHEIIDAAIPEQLDLSMACAP